MLQNRISPFCGIKILKSAVAMTLFLSVLAPLESNAEELPKPADVPQFLFASYEKNKNTFLNNVLIEAEEYSYNEKGEPKRGGLYTYKGGNQRFIFTQNILKKPSSVNYVWVGTPEGFLFIEKKTPTEGIILQKLPPTVKKFHEECRADLGVGMQLATFEVPFYKYLTLPDLKIESVRLEPWQGENLACITTNRTIKGGVAEKFYFDQQHAWVFRGSTRIMAQGMGTKVVSTVFYAEDGVTPTQWEYKMQKPDGSSKMIRKLNIIQYQKKAFPDDEFSLTQFGLPDPTNPGAGNSLRYLWWLLIAAGLISLAALFRYLSNKKKSQPIQPCLMGNSP